jgi:hypothetical protein
MQRNIQWTDKTKCREMKIKKIKPRMEKRKCGDHCKVEVSFAIAGQLNSPIGKGPAT